ncbi:globin domain-containing protein [Pseudonocardia sp. GCM10023141]|uniref:globin domain-containing protein n=1 Tax=Pseudonocardia sp. GCM10023141 TaxID=3252653 RepID=UPI003605E65B
MVRQPGSDPYHQQAATVAPAFVEPAAETLPASGIRRPSPATIAAVRASCRAVASRPVTLAEVFYEHLFEMAPNTRAMFPADMSEQMQKMTDTLLGAIAYLEQFDTAEMEATLRRLGAAHVNYGVLPEHYLYIGHALTRAVRDVAGSTYSGSLSSSWIAVYQWVAAHMLAGAQEAAEPVAEAVDSLPVALPLPRQHAEQALAPAPRDTAPRDTATRDAARR